MAGSSLTLAINSLGSCRKTAFNGYVNPLAATGPTLTFKAVSCGTSFLVDSPFPSNLLATRTTKLLLAAKAFPVNSTSNGKALAKPLKRTGWTSVSPKTLPVLFSTVTCCVFFSTLLKTNWPCTLFSVPYALETLGIDTCGLVKTDSSFRSGKVSPSESLKVSILVAKE